MRCPQVRKWSSPRRDCIKPLADCGYKVIGPMVRDGAIVYDEVASISDLPAGWTDEQEAGRYRLRKRGDQALFGYAVGPHSWKQFLHPPPIERLWQARRDGEGFSVIQAREDPPRYAFTFRRSMGNEQLDPYRFPIPYLQRMAWGRRDCVGCYRVGSCRSRVRQIHQRCLVAHGDRLYLLYPGSLLRLSCRPAASFASRQRGASTPIVITTTPITCRPTDTRCSGDLCARRSPGQELWLDRGRPRRSVICRHI